MGFKRWLQGRKSELTSSPTDTSPLRKSSLRIAELPSGEMAGLSSPGSAVSGSPSLALLAPIPNGSRVASGDVTTTTTTTTPTRLDSLKSSIAAPSPTAPSPHSAMSADQSPAGWSSAVGHATTSGKSGRVIEKLMSENDKLKRDLSEQVIRCQELERNLQTYKPQIEALRQENDNLTHARDVDSNLISRRDRKIEEMRAELATERQRRETAESMARQREREKEQLEEQTRREVQNMTDSTKHATVHAEILETSHRQLAAEYRARAEAWKKDLSGIVEAREQDRRRLARLDVVADQMRQELERSKKLNGEIVDAWERLRGEQDSRLQGIEDANETELERSRTLSAQMDEVIGQMRWVMGLKKNVKDDAF